MLATLTYQPTKGVETYKSLRAAWPNFSVLSRHTAKLFRDMMPETLDFPA